MFWLRKHDLLFWNLLLYFEHFEMQFEFMLPLKERDRYKRQGLRGSDNRANCFQRTRTGYGFHINEVLEKEGGSSSSRPRTHH